MDIGRPKRIIEIEPGTLPVPGEGEPAAPAHVEPEPGGEPPDREPAPAEPAGGTRR